MSRALPGAPSGPQFFSGANSSLFILLLFVSCVCSAVFNSGCQAREIEPSAFAAGIENRIENDPRLDTGEIFLGRGAEEFAKSKWKEAAQKFTKALSSASSSERPRLKLLIAVCLREQRLFNKASKAFAALKRELPEFSDYLYFNAARSAYFAQKRPAAEKFARKVSKGSSWKAQADLLIGDVLRGRKNIKKAQSHYEDYLSANPKGIRRGEALFYVASLMDAGKAPLRKKIKAYKEVLEEEPQSTWASSARSKLEKLTKRLPKSERKALAKKPNPGNPDIALAHRQLNAKQNKLAEKTLRKVLAKKGITQDERCSGQYDLGVAVWQQRRRTDAAPLFDVAIAECEKAKDDDLHVKSAYQAGRTYVMLDKAKEAIDRYSIIEKKHPKHSYADDARVLAARQYQWLGKNKEAEALLETVASKYPDGDMKSEAFWRLAWPAFKAKDYVAAEKWLIEQEKVVEFETHWTREGQALYWLARSRAERGFRAAAFDTYLETIEKYPLSYYSLLAFNRIRESDPIQFNHLLSTLGTPDGLQKSVVDSVLAKPAVRLGIEFARLGLSREARNQFTIAGITPPRHRNEVEDSTEEAALRVGAHLFYQADNFKDSHWILRWHALGYKRKWPRAKTNGTWRVAYPLAFWPTVRENATKNNVPPELLLGFIREESGFQPELESWAHAIGLTQLLIPTAKQFARGTDIKVTASSLRDPTNNIILGSRFMGYLLKRFNNHPALAIAAYNAGEGSMSNWLAERGTLPQDVFQEEIPFGEARSYSKRVLSSYFAYAYLGEGKVPEISQTVSK